MVERRPDGTWWPYLMDFGLAKEVDSSIQTSTGGVEGTPAYMAPEQVRGETRNLDARTDVYGLGATLYSSLAGQPPFVGNSTDVLIATLLDDPPKLRTFDSAIPMALQTIVEKCMEKDSRRRYASAQALAEDLGRFLEGARIAARPPGLLRRVGRFAQRHKLLMASTATALIASLVLGAVALRIRWQAAEQARLAERLGREIKDMEWLLRSARQLPLHDLGHEKEIIRRRMQKLQVELSTYGELSRGLAHYALGRGHMTLHEYPQALSHLQQALKLGVNSAELHYALGIVLGKHFEQAMYEARLAGGGEWAKKQTKEFEPRFLTPAIESLMRSRSMALDAPQYLEGLIAYYQRNYDGAIKQAEAALRDTPWMYEAAKLIGDVHLERALQARDGGRREEAEREFAKAVRNFENAAKVGGSDSEVYEGLAEAWVRQIEMAGYQGQANEAAYLSAIAASDKVEAAEPLSIAGPLKKAFGAYLTAAAFARLGKNPENWIQVCLGAAEAVLKKESGHPYASEIAAACNVLASLNAQANGKDPEPFLRKAQNQLEPIVKKQSKFLWGINDLGGIYGAIGVVQQLHGKRSAKEMFHKALDQCSAALVLDPTYPNAPVNALSSLLSLVSEAQSAQELQNILASADLWLSRCTAYNRQFQPCHNFYFQSYTLAASRALLAGQDGTFLLKRADEKLVETRKLGGQYLDLEQNAALLHRLEASERLRNKQDPMSALAEVQADLTRCLALAPQDSWCMAQAAQAEWIQAERLKPGSPQIYRILEAAQNKAKRATQSANISAYPDAWQVLAESHLRLAQRAEKQANLRVQHLNQGFAALKKLFAINPSHALGLATEGALNLELAQTTDDMALCRSAAQLAVGALEHGIQNDTFLTHRYAPLLETAHLLATVPK